MARMPREPEAFGEQVAKILQRHFPDRAVELAGPMDLVLNGKHLGLENLYRMVQYEPSRGVEIVENYLERLVEGDTIGSLPLPLSVAKPRIMLVIDMPHMTVSITVEQLVRWGLAADDLDVIARENLAQYSPQLEIQFVESTEGGRAAIVAAQDGYDAARLLLNTLHERLAPELHGDFYVATPARDMFLALTCDPPEFVDRLAKRVQLDYKRLPYPITNQLFVVTRDGVAGTVTKEAA